LKTDLSESKDLSNLETGKRDELLDDLLEWLLETEAPIPQEANPEYL
jgi:hypothetical protein